MNQTLSNETTESFSRAADALGAAQRDAYRAIDSAVDGLASAYGDAQPLLARIRQQARGYAHDSMDAVRQTARGLGDRSLRAVDTTRGYVRDEPLKSLLLAAAIGAAVIGLVELVRTRNDR